MTTTRADANRQIEILTQNVYFGANLEGLMTAKTPDELIAAVQDVWAQVEASNISERAAKIAQHIAALKPDLVGLQEVAQWSIGPPGAMSVKYDFLALILIAMREQGAWYVPIAIRNDLDQTAPLNARGELVQLLDRHAVLLRVDPLSQIQPYNIQAGMFSTLFPIAAFGIGVPRSWIAVDAIVNGARFRFIETHLESFDASVQTAQANELVTAAASTNLPVIMAGDFNSNGNQDPSLPDCTATYPALLAGGFDDAWAAVNPRDPGNTGCREADLRNAGAVLDRRLDLILTRGEMTAISAAVVGANDDARTPSGLWPSDHAGVVATLRI